MNKKGPVIIIEDDADDRKMLEEIFQSLHYEKEVIFFEDGHSAFEYLHSFRRKPFLILCDINMPCMNGFELRDKIYQDEELRVKCIPFLFLTTSLTPQIIMEAYSKSVQGFFVKPASYDDMYNLIKSIMEYWLRSESPFYFL